MSSEELSLTWGDHHSTLVGVFEKLLETSTLVDCTIAAEGQYLRAHKVVLSACSPYFELLFAQENDKNPIVILKDVKFQELKSMIDFIYRGKVKIPEDRLEDFIDAAESLQIKGLGGGQKSDSSQKKGNESPSAQKRGGLMSQAPRKRRRLSTEDAESKSSPKSDLNSESNSCESVSVTQEPSDILGLSQPEIPSPIVTLTTGSDVISPEVHIEQSDSETNPSTLPVECTLPTAETERLLEHAASVVKREPEPVAEIFLDDNDCFVDPKKEVCVEEMADLESDGISAVMEYVQQQQSTNQYSGAGSSAAVAPAAEKNTTSPCDERPLTEKTSDSLAVAPTCWYAGAEIQSTYATEASSGDTALVQGSLEEAGPVERTASVRSEGEGVQPPPCLFSEVRNKFEVTNEECDIVNQSKFDDTLVGETLEESFRPVVRSANDRMDETEEQSFLFPVEIRRFSVVTPEVTSEQCDAVDQPECDDMIAGETLEESTGPVDRTSDQRERKQVDEQQHFFSGEITRFPVSVSAEVMSPKENDANAQPILSNSDEGDSLGETLEESTELVDRTPNYQREREQTDEQPHLSGEMTSKLLIRVSAGMTSDECDAMDRPISYKSDEGDKLGETVEESTGLLSSTENDREREETQEPLCLLPAEVTRLTPEIPSEKFNAADQLVSSKLLQKDLGMGKTAPGVEKEAESSLKKIRKRPSKLLFPGSEDSGNSTVIDALLACDADGERGSTETRFTPSKMISPRSCVFQPDSLAIDDCRERKTQDEPYISDAGEDVCEGRDVASETSVNVLEMLLSSEDLSGSGKGTSVKQISAREVEVGIVDTLDVKLEEGREMPDVGSDFVQKDNVAESLKKNFPQSEDAGGGLKECLRSLRNCTDGRSQASQIPRGENQIRSCETLGLVSCQKPLQYLETVESLNTARTQKVSSPYHEGKCPDSGTVSVVAMEILESNESNDSNISTFVQTSPDTERYTSASQTPRDENQIRFCQLLGLTSCPNKRLQYLETSPGSGRFSSASQTPRDENEVRYSELLGVTYFLNKPLKYLETLQTSCIQNKVYVNPDVKADITEPTVFEQVTEVRQTSENSNVSVNSICEQKSSDTVTFSSASETRHNESQIPNCEFLRLPTPDRPLECVVTSECASTSKKQGDVRPNHDIPGPDSVSVLAVEILQSNDSRDSEKSTSVVQTSPEINTQDPGNVSVVAMEILQASDSNSEKSSCVLQTSPDTERFSSASQTPRDENQIRFCQLLGLSSCPNKRLQYLETSPDSERFSSASQTPRDENQIRYCGLGLTTSFNKPLKYLDMQSISADEKVDVQPNPEASVADAVSVLSVEVPQSKENSNNSENFTRIVQASPVSKRYSSLHTPQKEEKISNCEVLVSSCPDESIQHCEPPESDTETATENQVVRSSNPEINIPNAGSVSVVAMEIQLNENSNDSETSTCVQTSPDTERFSSASQTPRDENQIRFCQFLGLKSCPNKRLQYLETSPDTERFSSASQTPRDESQVRCCELLGLTSLNKLPKYLGTLQTAGTARNEIGGGSIRRENTPVPSIEAVVTMASNEISNSEKCISVLQTRPKEIQNCNCELLGSSSPDKSIPYFEPPQTASATENDVHISSNPEFNIPDAGSVSVVAMEILQSNEDSNDSEKSTCVQTSPDTERFSSASQTPRHENQIRFCQSLGLKSCPNKRLQYFETSPETERLSSAPQTPRDENQVRYYELLGLTTSLEKPLKYLETLQMASGNQNEVDVKSKVEDIPDPGHVSEVAMELLQTNEDSNNSEKFMCVQTSPDTERFSSTPQAPRDENQIRFCQLLGITSCPNKRVQYLKTSPDSERFSSAPQTPRDENQIRCCELLGLTTGLNKPLKYLETSQAASIAQNEVDAGSNCEENTPVPGAKTVVTIESDENSNDSEKLAYVVQCSPDTERISSASQTPRDENQIRFCQLLGLISCPNKRLQYLETSPESERCSSASQTPRDENQIRYCDVLGVMSCSNKPLRYLETLQSGSDKENDVNVSPSYEGNMSNPSSVSTVMLDILRTSDDNTDKEKSTCIEQTSATNKVINVTVDSTNRADTLSKEEGSKVSQVLFSESDSSDSFAVEIPLLCDDDSPCNQKCVSDNAGTLSGDQTNAFEGLEESQRVVNEQFCDSPRPENVPDKKRWMSEDVCFSASEDVISTTIDRSLPVNIADDSTDKNTDGIQRDSLGNNDIVSEDIGISPSGEQNLEKKTHFIGVPNETLFSDDSAESFAIEIPHISDEEFSDVEKSTASKQSPPATLETSQSDSVPKHYLRSVPSTVETGPKGGNSNLCELTFRETTEIKNVFCEVLDLGHREDKSGSNEGTDTAVSDHMEALSESPGVKSESGSVDRVAGLQIPPDVCTIEISTHGQTGTQNQILSCQDLLLTPQKSGEISHDLEIQNALASLNVEMGELPEVSSPETNYNTLIEVPLPFVGNVFCTNINIMPKQTLSPAGQIQFCQSLELSTSQTSVQSEEYANASENDHVQKSAIVAETRIADVPAVVVSEDKSITAAQRSNSESAQAVSTVYADGEIYTHEERGEVLDNGTANIQLSESEHGVDSCALQIPPYSKKSDPVEKGAVVQTISSKSFISLHEESDALSGSLVANTESLPATSDSKSSVGSCPLQVALSAENSGIQTISTECSIPLHEKRRDVLLENGEANIQPVRESSDSELSVDSSALQIALISENSASSVRDATESPASPSTSSVSVHKKRGDMSHIVSPNIDSPPMISSESEVSVDSCALQIALSAENSLSSVKGQTFTLESFTPLNEKRNNVMPDNINANIIGSVPVISSESELSVDSCALQIALSSENSASSPKGSIVAPTFPSESCALFLEASGLSHTDRKKQASSESTHSPDREEKASETASSASDLSVDSCALQIVLSPRDVSASEKDSDAGDTASENEGAICVPLDLTLPDRWRAREERMQDPRQQVSFDTVAGNHMVMLQDPVDMRVSDGTASFGAYERSSTSGEDCGSSSCNWRKSNEENANISESNRGVDGCALEVELSSDEYPVGSENTSQVSSCGTLCSPGGAFRYGYYIQMPIGGRRGDITCSSPGTESHSEELGVVSDPVISALGLGQTSHWNSNCKEVVAESLPAPFQLTSNWTSTYKQIVGESLPDPVKDTSNGTSTCDEIVSEPFTASFKISNETSNSTSTCENIVVESLPDPFKDTSNSTSACENIVVESLPDPFKDTSNDTCENFVAETLPASFKVSNETSNWTSSPDQIVGESLPDPFKDTSNGTCENFVAESLPASFKVGNEISNRTSSPEQIVGESLPDPFKDTSNSTSTYENIVVEYLPDPFKDTSNDTSTCENFVAESLPVSFKVSNETSNWTSSTEQVVGESLPDPFKNTSNSTSTCETIVVESLPASFKVSNETSNWTSSPEQIVGESLPDPFKDTSDTYTCGNIVAESLPASFEVSNETSNWTSSPEQIVGESLPDLFKDTSNSTSTCENIVVESLSASFKVSNETSNWTSSSERIVAESLPVACKDSKDTSNCASTCEQIVGESLEAPMKDSKDKSNGTSTCEGVVAESLPVSFKKNNDKHERVENQELREGRDAECGFEAVPLESKTSEGDISKETFSGAPGSSSEGRTKKRAIARGSRRKTGARTGVNQPTTETSRRSYKIRAKIKLDYSKSPVRPKLRKILPALLREPELWQLSTSPPSSSLPSQISCAPSNRGDTCTSSKGLLSRVVNVNSLPSNTRDLGEAVPSMLPHPTTILNTERQTSEANLVPSCIQPIESSYGQVEVAGAVATTVLPICLTETSALTSVSTSIGTLGQVVPTNLISFDNIVQCSNQPSNINVVTTDDSGNVGLAVGAGVTTNPNYVVVSYNDPGNGSLALPNDLVTPVDVIQVTFASPNSQAVMLLQNGTKTTQEQQISQLNSATLSLERNCEILNHSNSLPGGISERPLETSQPVPGTSLCDGSETTQVLRNIHLLSGSRVMPGGISFCVQPGAATQEISIVPEAIPAPPCAAHSAAEAGTVGALIPQGSGAASGSRAPDTHAPRAVVGAQNAPAGRGRRKPPRSYSCSVCDKVFPRMGVRDHHMRSHFASRPFECDVCDKTFKYPEGLYKHTLLHSPDTPFWPSSKLPATKRPEQGGRESPVVIDLEDDEPSGNDLAEQAATSSKDNKAETAREERSMKRKDGLCEESDGQGGRQAGERNGRAPDEAKKRLAVVDAAQPNGQSSTQRNARPLPQQRDLSQPRDQHASQDDRLSAQASGQASAQRSGRPLTQQRENLPSQLAVQPGPRDQSASQDFRRSALATGQVSDLRNAPPFARRRKNLPSQKAAQPGFRKQSQSQNAGRPAQPTGRAPAERGPLEQQAGQTRAGPQSQNMVRSTPSSSQASAPRDPPPRRAVPRVRRRFLCVECRKFLPSRDALQSHSRLHAASRPFVCDVCGRGFSHRRFLCGHRAVQHPDAQVHCDVCGVRFASYAALQSHATASHARLLRWRCRWCEQRFRSSWDLAAHRFHDECATFACDVCERAFPRAELLREHRRAHDAERTFQCADCDARFATVREYQQHIRQHGDSD